jgi:hypothetical protein
MESGVPQSRGAGVRIVLCGTLFAPLPRSSCDVQYLDVCIAGCVPCVALRNCLYGSLCMFEVGSLQFGGARTPPRILFLMILARREGAPETTEARAYRVHDLPFMVRQSVPTPQRQYFRSMHAATRLW